MFYGVVVHVFLFNHTISTYIQASSRFISWDEAVWHWWSVVYAVFSTGGDLGPVQSQLVEDLSNFCHSCPTGMCQHGMLDCQSGVGETTGFREIQKDSERFREIKDVTAPTQASTLGFTLPLGKRWGKNLQHREERLIERLLDLLSKIRRSLRNCAEQLAETAEKPQKLLRMIADMLDEGHLGTACGFRGRVGCSRSQAEVPRVRSMLRHNISCSFLMLSL